jgi:ribose 5-phosphate isomerase A
MNLRPRNECNAGRFLAAGRSGHTMSEGGSVSQQKRAAAHAAVAEVADGMVVGLGTGSTAAFAVEAIGQRQLSIRGVPTSRLTEGAARAAGIDLIEPAEAADIDLAIDGVDEIDGQLRAIKGGGGAMLREKIVAAAARRMVAIADSSKRVDRLGARPVPVETLSFGLAATARQLEALGAVVTRRRSDGGGWFVTDQGNAILDCAFGPLDDPDALAGRIDAVPGALGHGLFTTEIDALYLGQDDGSVQRFERTPPTHEGKGATE